MKEAGSRALNAAAIRAQRGDVARTQLNYDQAAEHFRTAADLVPAGQDDVRADYLHRQARALYSKGHEFGDNDALRKSIVVWNEVLALRLRERSRGLSLSTTPSCWASCPVQSTCA